MASGVVSDYADTTGLQQKIATLVGVSFEAVAITVVSASVNITATIAVDESTTVAAVRAALAAREHSLDRARGGGKEHTDTGSDLPQRKRRVYIDTVHCQCLGMIARNIKRIRLKKEFSCMKGSQYCMAVLLTHTL